MDFKQILVLKDQKIIGTVRSINISYIKSDDIISGYYIELQGPFPKRIEAYCSYFHINLPSLQESDKKMLIEYSGASFQFDLMILELYNNKEIFFKNIEEYIYIIKDDVKRICWRENGFRFSIPMDNLYITHNDNIIIENVKIEKDWR